MTSYLPAIGYAHKLAGASDPTETAIIRQILKGYRKLAPVRDVLRFPITLPILRQFVASFQHTTESAYQFKMFSAMCYIAFFAFLGIGEVTINGSDQSNLIRPNQLSRLMTTQGQVVTLQLTIYKYKHSTNGRPIVIDIFEEESCCPVKAVLPFISVRGTTKGPLFCWPGGAPITRSIFVEQLNRALRFCNLDPTLCKAHSFRVGAATWAAA